MKQAAGIVMVVAALVAGYLAWPADPGQPEYRPIEAPDSSGAPLVLPATGAVVDRRSEVLAARVIERPKTVTAPEWRQFAAYIERGVVVVPPDAPDCMQVLALLLGLKLHLAGMVSVLPDGIMLHDTATGCTLLLAVISDDDGQLQVIRSSVVTGELPPKYGGDLAAWFGAR